MRFSTDEKTVITIWEISDEPEKNNMRCKVSHNYFSKPKNAWVDDLKGYIYFKGNARDAVLNATGDPVRIVIDSGDLYHVYDAESKTMKTYVTVWECHEYIKQEQKADNTANNPDFLNIPDSIQEELPFK